MFSEILTIAFLEMSIYNIFIYFERKFFSDPKFCKVFCSYLEKFHLPTLTSEQ